MLCRASVCSVDGCGKPQKHRGCCGAHYLRWWRHGDTLVQKNPTNGEALRFYREVVLLFHGDECLIWPYARDQHGYARLAGTGDTQYVSRLACEELNGPPPTSKHEAAHSCGKGNLGCVNPGHLSWKTHKANQHDRFAHGTHTRGEQHPLSKLTERDVREIRGLPKDMRQASIAAKYGVSRRTIGMVLTGKNWAHV